MNEIFNNRASNHHIKNELSKSFKNIDYAQWERSRASESSLKKSTTSMKFN